MGKSRAEIQKAYRQRLKAKDNKGYLEKEKARRRASYVPSSQLSRKERRERNEKNRERLRRFYDKKRNEQNTENEGCNEQDTSGYDTADSALLQVNFQFPNRRKGPQKRWKEELSKAKERIKQLEEINKEAKRSNSTLRRKLQRIKQKNNSSNTGNLTPRKEVEQVIKRAQLCESQRYIVKKPLLLASAITKEIDATKRNARKIEKRVLYRVVNEKIIKKYKCLTALAYKTGLDGHCLSKVKGKTMAMVRSVRRCKRWTFDRKVRDFFERAEQSQGKLTSRKMKREKNRRHVY